MDAFGLILCIALGILGLCVLYFVIKWAVRDGIIAAKEELSEEKAPEADKAENQI